MEFSHNVSLLFSDGRRKKYRNRVLANGILYLADYILGDVGDPITYIGVGDDPEPNVAGTDSMGNEIYRKAFTTKYRDGTRPVFETFFTREEANFHWREIGLFAGGTSDPGTGLLIARVVVDEVKNDNITISHLWEFRIANT